MNRVNYQKELDKILEALEKEYAGSAAVKSEADEQHGAKAQRSPAERRGPDERCGRVSGPDFAPVRKKLLLHSCCAPCSSYVLEYLSRYFDITVFYYNPNITQRGEYDRRVEEQGRLICLMNEEKERTSREEGKERPCVNGILLEKGAYEPERFFELAKGLEDVPEGGERCRRCYWLRLSETARLAALGGYDYFTTTLTISPMKNAGWLNEIGEQLAERITRRSFRRISRRRTDISAPWNYRSNTGSIARITAAVSFPKWRGTKGMHRRKSGKEKTMKKVLDAISEEMKKGFRAAGYDEELGKVTLSNRPDLCEYQCNGAMAGAKKYHKAPLLIAQEVAEALQESEVFAEVGAVAPGFLNLKLSESFLASYLEEMSTADRFGMQAPEKKETIIIDYGGPNVAKPLHVGHLRSAVIGESVKRIARYAGHEVIGDIHLGDWGLQMGQIITELQERKPKLPYFDENYTGEYPEEAPFTISELEEIYPTASGKCKVDEAYRERAMENPAFYRMAHGDTGLCGITSSGYPLPI